MSGCQYQGAVNAKDTGTENKKSSGDLAILSLCVSWRLCSISFTWDLLSICITLLFSFWLLLPHKLIQEFPNSIPPMVLASTYVATYTSNSDVRSGTEEWVSCPWVRSLPRSNQVWKGKWSKQYQYTEPTMSASRQFFWKVVWAGKHGLRTEI